MDDFIIKNNVLIRYRGNTCDAVIPDGVTEITESVFYGCTNLRSVTIPDGVTKIGCDAFGECENLQSVTIPDGVTSIGMRAFKECTNLRSITIPDSVTEIGDCAFTGCQGLSDSEGFVIICNFLFSYHGEDSNITIPNNVTVISSDAFRNCTNLENIIISESVMHIGNNVFSGCTNLTSITIPNSIKGIKEGIFYGCSNLKKIKMPFELLNGNPFFPSSKMATLELTDKEEINKAVPALFRMEYPSNPKWIHSEDFLIPIGSENIQLFDSVIASGSFDGFKTNEDGRIQSILFRLNDKEEPIRENLISPIKDFLLSKFTKVIKISISENALDNIYNLISIGVITPENENKVCKLLEKSEDESVKSMATALGSMILQNENGNTNVEEKFPLEEKFEVEYKKLDVVSQMVKYGIEIPELKSRDGNGTVPKEYLELYIAMYMKEPSREDFYTKKIIPIADEAAEMIDRGSLNEILLDIYNKQGHEKNKLAVLNPVLRFADSETVEKIYKELHNQYNSRIVLNAIFLNDSKTALMIADKNGYMGMYAFIHGLGADYLRYSVLADFGLNEDGEKVYDIGGTTIVATLQKDLTIKLFDTIRKKEVKSIPKRGNDEKLVEIASKDYNELRKNVKKVAKNHFDRLFEDFLSGNKIEGKKWKEIYCENPLLRIVAELIVWSQNGVSFTLKDRKAIISSNDEYVINDDPICVAHPIEMPQDEVKKWQMYFTENGLKQPFMQIWESAINPETIKPNRYEGFELPINIFRGSRKHGLVFFDEDDHNNVGAYVDIPGCELEISRTSENYYEILPGETFTLGKLTIERYSRAINHLVCTLDRWTILGRIKNDDLSIKSLLNNFTLAQIESFIDFAVENNAINVSAMLIEYNNKNFSEYSHLDKYVLENF